MNCSLLSLLFRQEYGNDVDTAPIVITTENLLMEALWQGVINFPDINLVILAPGIDHKSLLERYRLQRRRWKNNIQVIGHIRGAFMVKCITSTKVSKTHNFFKV